MIEKCKQWLLRAGDKLRAPKAKKWGGWLAAIWLAFALFGYFVAPPLAKSVLLSQLGQALDREVSIETISINPLNLSIEVDGLSVKNRAGGEQFGFGQLYVNLSSFSIAQAGIVVDEIRLQAPRVAIARLADGQFDISDLLDRWLGGQDKGPTALPRFSLNNIQISDGTFELDDRPKGVRHKVEAIRFNLPFISSLPYKADVFVLPAFSAVVDGSEFSLQGRSKPFAPTHDSELALHLDKLDLSRLQPYLPASLPLRLKAGQLATALNIHFAEQAGGVQSLSLSGTAQLQGLALTEAAGKPFLALDKLELALQQANPLQGRYEIGQLDLHGLHVGQAQAPAQTPLRIAQLSVQQARVDVPAHRLEAAQVHAAALQAQIVRTAQGGLAWVELPALSSPARAPAGQAGASAPSPDWAARIGRLSFEELGLRLDDRTLSPPTVQEIEHASLTVDKLDSTPGQKSEFTLSATVNRSGSLKSSGSLQLQPLVAHLKLETQALPMAPLQGYVDPYLNASMVQGQLSNQGELDIQQQAGALKASYKGRLALDRFRAVDKANSADFLKWKSLYVGAVDFQLDPMRLNIGEVALSDFYSRLILNKEGRLNLMDLVRTPAGPDKAPEPASAATRKPPLPLRIAKVTLQNGQVNFSDYFVRPNYSANVSKLGGSIQNLSSAADTLADLDLRGSYASNAPVHIAARLNPLAEKKFLDLKADVSSIDLVDFSPYSGKYAGYNIDKGKLSLNATYKLQDRQLTAENRIFIDQLTFGDKVESPDATQLPVHLAIALLKNNRGEIDINLPISGSLDDPHFSIGGLIFKVIANLFVKAVTAPFALLGAMFGDGQELSQIAFAPGRAHLDEAALKKLDALAKAMREREGLSLEITAGADQDLDQEGLKRAALERAMQAEQRKDRASPPRDSASAPETRMADSEYVTYLTRVYKQAKFPKPRNLIGMAKDLPVPEMEKLLLANQSVSDEDMRTLAARRGQAAQTWLVEQGQVPLSRIFLLPVKIEAAAGSPPGSGRNRVDFSLR